MQPIPFAFENKAETETVCLADMPAHGLFYS